MDRATVGCAAKSMKRGHVATADASDDGSAAHDDHAAMQDLPTAIKLLQKLLPALRQPTKNSPPLAESLHLILHRWRIDAVARQKELGVSHGVTTPPALSKQQRKQQDNILDRKENHAVKLLVKEAAREELDEVLNFVALLSTKEGRAELIAQHGAEHECSADAAAPETSADDIEPAKQLAKEDAAHACFPPPDTRVRLSKLTSSTSIRLEGQRGAISHYEYVGARHQRTHHLHACYLLTAVVCTCRWSRDRYAVRLDSGECVCVCRGNFVLTRASATDVVLSMLESNDAISELHARHGTMLVTQLLQKLVEMPRRCNKGAVPPTVASDLEAIRKHRHANSC